MPTASQFIFSSQICISLDEIELDSLKVIQIDCYLHEIYVIILHVYLTALKASWLEIRQIWNEIFYGALE